MELEALVSQQEEVPEALVSEPERVHRASGAGRRVVVVAVALGAIGAAIALMSPGIRAELNIASVEALFEFGKGEKNACSHHTDTFKKCVKNKFKIHHGYAKDPINCKNKCERTKWCTSWNVADGCEVCGETGDEDVEGTGGSCWGICGAYDEDSASCVTEETAPKCLIQKGDVKGDDISDGELKDTDAEACQKSCESNADCHCFAFDPSRDNTCWLKGEGCGAGSSWSESGDMTSGTGCQG